MATTCFVFACGIDTKQDEQRGDRTERTERTGNVTQALNVAYDTFITGLAPQAWYKFDETSPDGGALNSIDAGPDSGLTGTYVVGEEHDDAGLLGNPGAIDGSTAVHFGTTSLGTANPTLDGGVYRGPHMTVPDNTRFSLTKGADNFQRDDTLFSNSWGTPSSPDTNGGSWSWIASSGNYYVVSSGYSGASGGRINETGATGTWGQKFPAPNRLDTDSQVDLMWSPTGLVPTATGTFNPLTLMARYTDTSNYYGARITEANGVTSLVLLKKQTGTYTYYQTVTLSTTFTPLTHWMVRLQVDSGQGPTSVPSNAKVNLRAKAWVSGTAEPRWTDATVATGTDDPAAGGSPLPTGGSAILSANSGSSNHSSVFFHDYRIQPIGFSVSFWMKPTTEAFTGFTGPLCSGGTLPGNYVHPVNKNDNNQAEWVFRHYPENATDSCTDRRWAVSAYGFSITPSNPGNLGAGARWNPSGTLATAWHHILGVYDPGDSLDRQAGVMICTDGTCYPKVEQTVTDGTYTKGVNYADPSYPSTLSNGTAPLRVGMFTNNSSSASADWLQYQGDLDELMFFDYRLCPLTALGSPSTCANETAMYGWKN